MSKYVSACRTGSHPRSLLAFFHHMAPHKGIRESVSVGSVHAGCVCLLIRFCMCAIQAEQDLQQSVFLIFLFRCYCYYPLQICFGCTVVFACRRGKMRTLISVTAQPLVSSPASPAVCTKQDECDGNCNTITNNKSHPVYFQISSSNAHAREHAHTQTHIYVHVQKGVDHIGIALRQILIGLTARDCAVGYRFTEVQIHHFGSIVLACCAK